MQTIYILWLRGLKRYSRSRARIFASLAQPVLFLVALGFGFGPIYTRAGGGDYITFLAPGVIAMSVLFTAVFSGMDIIWDKQFGFLKETLVAPVSRTAILLGRMLGGATVALIQGCIVFLVTLIVGFRPSTPQELPLAVLFLFAIALLFTGLGSAIAAKLDDMQGFPLIMNFLVMPLFFLSGALFPLNQLPTALTVVTSLNPLSYGIDGVRGTLGGIHQFPYALDAAVLVVVIAVVTTVGTILFSQIEA
ncbi:MAG TPA: ABC transporter permease [Candidatus Baltobacteraceae bacterium]|jgi:ABC-2 type transport system permease protein|nr:ABC transporter permease [Candidatus Baltobacteraceae bacterium]